MADISVLLPMITMIGMMFFILLGLAALFKAFYKKVPAGEVMIVSTMATDPLIVRNGTLVYPIIYNASNIDMNSVPIEIESDLKDMFRDKFELNISTISLQVIDTEEAILDAHRRISTTNASDRTSQLTSIMNLAVREHIKDSNSVQDLKSNVNGVLSKVGYELVV